VNNDFWDFLDRLIFDKRIVVDRTRGTPHPAHPEIIYPLDYGYLEGTRSGDGEEIDVWMGASPIRRLSGLILTCDARKCDIEIKLLLGCTNQETQTILAFHNAGEMRAIGYPRPEENT